MRIFILGAGKMGAWFVEELCHDHEIAVYDVDKKKMKYFFNVERMMDLSEVQDFKPELMINAVSLQNTVKAFDAVLEYLPVECILSDIMSVKNDIKKYYEKAGRKFVSTHPMFGPTFANIRDLKDESAIIIKESCEEGRQFFRDFYKSLDLNIYEYTFEEHDKVTAYSLGTPFTSSLVFAACMKKQDAPGTTFRKHMEIAKGLLSEDDYLITEVLFNQYTLAQIEKINSQLAYLTHIIRGRDYEQMRKFINKLRDNINQS
jgi:prephenate dehydrogenase